MSRLTKQSASRVQMTKVLKHSWRRKLDLLQSRDVFKIDYSLAKGVLLGKVLNILDAKCPTKSNVKIIFKAFLIFFFQNFCFFYNKF